MIEYIQGQITALTPTQAVLETAGIGYAIQISLPVYSQLQGQTSARLYIHEAIREDAHILYGFLHPEDRQLFLLLISVSGIGANTARMILSSYSPNELQELISTANERALSAIKGIGVKTAQRIIVDLKDKIIKVDLGSSGGTGKISGLDNSNRDEAVAALNMLGFTVQASQKAVDSILKNEPSTQVEQLIRLALKMM